MGLYLGEDKLKIYLDGINYHLNFIPETFVVYGIQLLSSDGYTLKDVNGLYLTSKESE